MSLSPEKLAEIEESLKTVEIINADDRVVDDDQGDYWENFSCSCRSRSSDIIMERAIVFAGAFGSTC